ncbi:hypothetical protein OIU91_20950 [Streptomyces sp. NBC_01456]|uniref:hypothetical protein n=1 Tax=unclassified Streptomyces TaxID=2593676 RepID=UPI002E36817C|nr:MULTISPECIES: hypothetical protein [unclassified Streptomyces]
MNGPGTGPVPDGTAPHGPVEERLRQALAARAESIGIRDLRPAAPPGPHLRRGRLSVLRRPWLRRFGLPLAAAAAAAAIAVGLLVTAPDGPPDRPLPARPPSPVSPAPSTGSDRPSAPEPSPTRPPATPHHSTGPSGAPPGTARPHRPGTATAGATAQPGDGSTGTPGPPSTPPPATPTPEGTSTAGHPASPSTQAVH